MAFNISAETSEFDNDTVEPDANQPASVSLPDINLFFAVFLPLLSIATIVGNAGVMLAFLKVPALQEKPSDLLILNLSVTDFFLGWIMLIFMTPYFVSGMWPYGEIGCMIWAGSGNLLVSASLYTLCAISWDRVLLVVKEYPSYVKLQSRTRIKVTIGLCWILSLIPMTLELSMWKRAKENVFMASLINFNYICLSLPRLIKAFSLSGFFIFVLTPILMVTVLSAVFLYFLHLRLRKNRQVAIGGGSASANETTSHSAGNTATSTVEGNGVSAKPNTNEPNSKSAKSHRFNKRYIKPAVTLAALVFAMAVCMLPYSIYVILGTFCPTCVANINSRLRYALLLLTYCNATLDPLLYSMTQSKIKGYYKSKLRNMCR